MLPKVAGGESHMGNMAGRTSLQDLVKSAMVSSAERVQVTREAARQAGNLGEKTASANAHGTFTNDGTKIASAQEVEKLACALDFIVDSLKKEASMGGPYSLSEKTQAPPPGVSAAQASTPLPDKKGQGVNVVPMHPGTQKGLSTEHGGTQMANTLDHAPGGREHMVQKNASVGALILAKLKTASSDHEKKETEGLQEAKAGVEKAEAAHKSEPENKSAAAEKCKDCGKEKDACSCSKTASENNALVDYMLSRTTKQAEDAINPAQISAGPAVPPETSQAGQSGGKPAGGMPQGPTGLVGSNESAKNYTRGQAYSNRKDDLGRYFKEPAMSAQHDNVLQVAFKHTGQAGPKIASAEGATQEEPASPAPAVSVKTAAAKALLMNLAKTAEAEIAKTASSKSA